MSRFARFLIALVASAALLCPGIGHAKLARGGAIAPTGFFPAGHWIVSPISSSMVPIFPLADGVTSSTAREHWAFWNGTNDIPYDLAIGVEFGAYPYICTLVLGPPGMVVEQSIYTTFQNPAYCRVLWHPQGNISSSWSGEVEVAVTDQQHNTIDMSWALATDDTTTHFVFVSTTGSGSTCTYSIPCSFTTAFGSTFAATSFPGAVCYVFGGSYTGATNLPVYTDTDTGVNGFEPYSTRKPDAIIGIPGQTVTLDGTAGDVSTLPHFIQLGGHAPDWYMENTTVNGYNTAAVDQYVLLGTSSRLTFDQTYWTNTGYGTGGAGNMSVFVTSGQQTLRQYLFITDSVESGRETGAGVNNIGFIDLYAFQYALIQRDSENSPGVNLESAFYFKIDEVDSELRENYINSTVTQGLGGFGSQSAGNGSNQVDYNLAVGLGEIQVGGSDHFTWQGLAVFRNTILSGANPGLVNSQTAYNLEGPGGPGYVNVVGTTGGTLTAGDEYTWCVTSLGNTGESGCTIGSYGSASGAHGPAAGSSNQNAYTLPGSDTAAVVSYLAEPGATGYNGYRELTSCGGGAGCWTQYSLGNVLTWTDTGAAGTTAAPPSTSTAIVTAAPFTYLSNIFATTNATAPPPTGAVITDANNVVDSSGASSIVCLSVTTGCAAIGQLNSTYSGYSSLIGERGYQLQ
jgi:hypothetical protein